MRELLRDIALALAPSDLRRMYPPASTARVRDLALATGLLQCLLSLAWLALRGQVFMARQYARLSSNLPLDAGPVPFYVFLFSYLLYPMSLVLLYFTAEGAVRWLAALINGEIVPSGPVALTWKIISMARQREENLRHATALPDKVEVFDNGGRVHVSCCFPHPHWNATITISIQGENYEVEKSLPGMAPYACLYVLRRAPLTKVRRGYEEYELPR